MLGNTPAVLIVRRHLTLALTWRVVYRRNGRRGRNRTCNRRIRNPMLYPFELRALNK